MDRLFAVVEFRASASQIRQAAVRCSPGLLDNNPEQVRNKLKISAYVLETT